MANTAAPKTSACTRSRPPSARVAAWAASAQTTPEIVPASVLCNPGTPPPAATAQARPTSTGQSDRFTLAISEIARVRSEEHTSELQSRLHLVCRLLLEKKKKKTIRCSGQSYLV